MMFHDIAGPDRTPRDIPPVSPGCRMTRPSTAGGFTLIELLISVAIIGIIAAIAVPALQTAMDKSKQRATMADMRSLGQAVQYYEVDESAFPDGATTCSALVTMVQKYIKNFLPYTDKWQHDYGYDSDRHDWYSLESYGKDGIDGVDITLATRMMFEQDIVYATGRFVNSPEP
jgi:type II secretion system protein G